MFAAALKMSFIVDMKQRKAEDGELHSGAASVIQGGFTGVRLKNKAKQLISG